MSPVQFSYDPNTLPRVFRAKDKWPGLIGGAKDQVEHTQNEFTKACQVSDLMLHQQDFGSVWNMRWENNPKMSIDCFKLPFSLRAGVGSPGQCLRCQCWRTESALAEVRKYLFEKKL